MRKAPCRALRRMEPFLIKKSLPVSFRRILHVFPKMSTRPESLLLQNTQRKNSQKHTKRPHAPCQGT